MTGIQQLQKARRDLQRRKNQLKGAESRLDVAQRDVEWFRSKIDADRIVIGECWLDLMISGISHRQFLHFILEYEDEKLDY